MRVSQMHNTLVLGLIVETLILLTFGTDTFSMRVFFT